MFELRQKTTRIYWLAVLALALVVILTACSQSGTTTTITATTTVPATTTITATATVTNTATQTTTVAPPATPTGTAPGPTTTVTATVTVQAPTTTTPPPDISAQLQKNNNGHFLIGREITGYNRVLQPDGTYQQTPLYRFVYYDFDLLSFITNQGAIFIPRIPTFTNFDDWYVKFSTKQLLYPTPFKINWALITKSGSVSAQTSLRFYTQSYFDANYYNAPLNLGINNLGPDLAVDDQGVHFAELSLYEDFVALIRTDNAADILGWWIKIGQLH